MLFIILSWKGPNKDHQSPILNKTAPFQSSALVWLIYHIIPPLLSVSQDTTLLKTPLYNTVHISGTINNVAHVNI